MKNIDLKVSQLTLGHLGHKALAVYKYEDTVSHCKNDQITIVKAVILWTKERYLWSDSIGIIKGRPLPMLVMLSRRTGAADKCYFCGLGSDFTLSIECWRGETCRFLKGQPETTF
jgi:hypothetical protein